MKRPAKRLLAIAIGLFLGCLLAEFAIRLRCTGRSTTELFMAQVHQSDSVLSYRLTPGASARGTHINSLGMRGVEVPAARTAGVMRILCLGDSITYGEAVEDDADTYPAVLGRELAAHGHQVEVLNAGVMGYTSRQCLAWLTELLPKVRPDLVLCCTGWNDFTCSRLRGWHSHIDCVTPWDPWQLDESWLLEYVRRKLFATPHPPNPHAFEFYDREVRAIVGLCRDSGARVALLDLPSVFTSAMTKAAIDKAAINGFVPAEVSGFLTICRTWHNVAETLHVPLLRTGFEYEVEGKTGLLSDVCHPNKEGYLHMVQVLLPQVEALLQLH
jgi:lysophospholipase L1-like esterase